MNQFFKFLFASCLGTVLALGLLFFVGIGWIASLASNITEEKSVSIEPNSVLELNLEMPIPEKTNNLPLDPFDKDHETVLGLTDMVHAIKTAKDDPDIKGIYLNIKYLATGKATASTLRRALIDFKSSGKFIYAYGDYYAQSTYYLASVADSIMVNPLGMVDFRGYSSMMSYYKGMLDKLDVQMRIFYAGKFKSATEPFRMDKMSDENRLQVREYLNEMNNILLADVSESRKIPVEQLRQIANNFDARTAEGALAAHMVDRIAYEDEAFSAIKSRLGLDEKDKLHRVSVEDYFASKGRGTDFSVKDKIAVVYLEGSINDGDSGEPGEIFDGKVVKDLRAIRQDDAVKAVVLRINSPGGSVLASENILREVALLKKMGRPVVVSMGDLAASGGYYVTCGADSIFAEPNTITGSIGVFGMVPILQKTMKDNLGITYDTVRTGRFSAFGSPFYDFSPEEGQMIQSSIERIYQDFLKKVAASRHKTPEAIHEIAQGRVWTGKRAVEIGLVDALGGLDRALVSAAKLAGLEKYRTTEYPRTKKGFEQFLEKFTKDNDGEDAKAWLMREQLGDLYPAFKSLSDLRKARGLQARLPFEMIVQ